MSEITKELPNKLVEIITFVQKYKNSDSDCSSSDSDCSSSDSDCSSSDSDCSSSDSDCSNSSSDSEENIEYQNNKIINEFINYIILIWNKNSLNDLKHILKKFTNIEEIKKFENKYAIYVDKKFKLKKIVLKHVKETIQYKIKEIKNKFDHMINVLETIGITTILNQCKEYVINFYIKNNKYIPFDELINKEKLHNKLIIGIALFNEEEFKLNMTFTLTLYDLLEKIIILYNNIELKERLTMELRDMIQQNNYMFIKMVDMMLYYSLKSNYDKKSNIDIVELIKAFNFLVNEDFLVNGEYMFTKTLTLYMFIIKNKNKCYHITLQKKIAIERLRLVTNDSFMLPHYNDRDTLINMEIFLNKAIHPVLCNINKQEDTFRIIYNYTKEDVEQLTNTDDAFIKIKKYIEFVYDIFLKMITIQLEEQSLEVINKLLLNMEIKYIYETTLNKCIQMLKNKQTLFTYHQEQLLFDEYRKRLITHVMENIDKQPKRVAYQLCKVKSTNMLKDVNEIVYMIKNMFVTKLDSLLYNKYVSIVNELVTNYFSIELIKFIQLSSFIYVISTDKTYMGDTQQIIDKLQMFTIIKALKSDHTIKELTNIFSNDISITTSMETLVERTNYDFFNTYIIFKKGSNKTGIKSKKKYDTGLIIKKIQKCVSCSKLSHKIIKTIQFKNNIPKIVTVCEKCIINEKFVV
jgi:hypothetical protein